jgi:uncharacterized tellurite resistance protein B-like protein
MRDRIDTICNLLLGAAYADDFFHDKEKEAIRELLAKLIDGEVPGELEERIESFDAAGFDVAAAAAEFADDSDDDKYKLLELIAVVHEADDEFDFAEDDYVRAVAEAVGLGAGGLTKFTLEYEVEELKEDLGQLRTPPPIPGAK